MVEVCFELFDVFVKEAQIYLEKYRVALQKKFDNDKYKNISDKLKKKFL